MVFCFDFHWQNSFSTIVACHIVTKPCILQKCVKERAVKSILCVREISKQEAEDVVESVFDACFHDTDPFQRIPP